MKTLLNRYELNFDQTWEYIYNNLQGGNTLSSELLHLIDFRKGRFFTLLPNDANLERKYEFEAGLVLKQNPVQEYFINGKKCTYSEIPTINEQIAYLIIQKTKYNNKLSCVFEEVLASPGSKLLTFFHKNNLFYTYRNEVYFLITKDSMNPTSIKKCLQHTNVIWHSLCVLTKAEFPIKSPILSLENIQEICLNSELIIIGAYDGEGYVFWEKISY